MYNRERFDWDFFWLAEVVSLTVPLFAAILSLQSAESLSRHALGVIAFVWLVLTLLNLAICSRTVRRSGGE